MANRTVAEFHIKVITPSITPVLTKLKIINAIVKLVKDAGLDPNDCKIEVSG